MATVLEIRLFGGLYVGQQGLPVSGFVSSKAPALLAYLAVTGRAHQRDSLAALLWGELPEADARNNLRQALANLRKLLAPYLVISRESVAVDRDAQYTLDTDHFESLLHQSRVEGGKRYEHLARAASLYQGDFLAGFYVRDAPEFEEWMLAQRARYRELALHALHQLAEQHLSRGEFGRAIDAATRLLALDAWREEAHRQLMLALARSGRRSAALAQYETCRRLLEQELGVEPAAETTALYERIRTARHEVRLPLPDTPFVGRAAELDRISRLLADPTARLVTISGPGGSGKSRLALEAAGRAAERYLHGAYFAPLAATVSLEAVPGALADVLGLTLGGRNSPADQLLGYLRDKELLLLLDNLEHLPQADELVGRLAEACPEVKLLVTSRGRLNLHGERLVELTGLDIPPADSAPNISEYGAVQLFVTSAQSVQPGFALGSGPGAGNGTEAAVARICRLVGGLPLAIELAAAWVRHMSCAEIAVEIAHSLDLLATTQKNVPERHRSLLAAFDHSWALLSEDERQCFARLAVFRGGCEREAATAVSGGKLPTLAALCDKSLLRRDHAGRYTLHELLRQFAQTKLEADLPECAATKQRHIAYYVAFLAAREEALSDARQNDARREIAGEMDNIRAAWSRALEQRAPELLEPGLESMRHYMEQAGRFSEAADMFAAAVAVEEERGGGDSQLRGRLLLSKLLARQAWFEQRLDRHGPARELTGRALEILRGADLPAEEGLCYACLGNVARTVGDFEQTANHYQRSVELLRRADRPGDIAYSLNGMAVAYTELGELDIARATHEESLVIKRRLGDRRGAGVTLHNLGSLALAQADYDAARRLSREALEIFREVDYPFAVALALNNHGFACYCMGEYEPARDALLESMKVNREVGNQHLTVHTLGTLGAVAGAFGDFEESRRLTGESLSLARQIGSTSGATYGLLCAAILFSRQEQYERAVESATVVTLHPSTNRESRDRARRLLADLTERLPTPLMYAAVERGRALELETAVAAFLGADDMQR